MLRGIGLNIQNVSGGMGMGGDELKHRTSPVSRQTYDNILLGVSSPVPII